MKAMTEDLPENAIWAGFAFRPWKCPWWPKRSSWAAMSGSGLEDNLYLEKGVFASNGQLVERAIKIIELMGARAVTPAEAREKLNLRARN